MRRSRRRLLAGIVLAVAIASAGCAGQPGDDADAGQGDAAGTPADTPTSEPTAGPTADSPAATAGSVPEALQVVAPALDGGEIDFADFAGRDVALWMWAPW